MLNSCLLLIVKWANVLSSVGTKIIKKGTSFTFKIARSSVLFNN